MKLTIQGSAKEIAALVLVVQERREEVSVPAIDIDELFHHSVKADPSCLQFVRPESQLHKESIQALVSEGMQQPSHLD